MKIQIVNLGLLVLLGSIGLSGCGTDSKSSTKILNNTSETTANNAAIQIMRHTVIPAANHFQAQAQLLNEHSELFCSAGYTNEANLLTAQQQWKATTQAWYQLLPFKFGPMEGGLDINIVEPIYAYIDFFRFNKGNDQTLTIRNKVKTWVDGPTPANITTEFLNTKSASLVGLLPLEVTLFETTDTQSNAAADVLNEFNNQARKCQLLTSLSERLLLSANEIKNGWLTNYGDAGKGYIDLLTNDELESAEVNDSGDSAISKIVVSVQDYFDYLKNRSVTSQGHISGSIWQSLAASVPSVEAVLSGTDETTLSINDIMNSNERSVVVTNVQSNIDTLKTAISEENSTDFKAAAGILDGNFKRDVPDALDVRLGFNFTDGD